MPGVALCFLLSAGREASSAVVAHLPATCPHGTTGRALGSRWGT